MSKAISNKERSLCVQEISTLQRCAWAQNNQLAIDYHDTEWGVPKHKDKVLFEFLLLEGAQAGLNWTTILKKRDGYRNAFAGFDARQVAQYSDATRQELLLNPEIIRNKLKVAAAVQNARAFLTVQQQFGSFDTFLWRFVGGEPKQNTWNTTSDIPTRTLESDTLSKELKRLGFSFVGTTICYALMQAIGMVNDHTIDCFRWHEVKELSL